MPTDGTDGNRTWQVVPTQSVHKFARWFPDDVIGPLQSLLAV
jgi:hypothetical protein